MELCKKPEAEEERKLKRLLVSNYQRKGGTLAGMEEKDKHYLRPETIRLYKDCCSEQQSG